MSRIMVDIIERRIKECVMEYITTGNQHYQINVVFNINEIDTSKIIEIFNKYKTLKFTDAKYKDNKPYTTLKFKIKNAKEFI